MRGFCAEAGGAPPLWRSHGGGGTAHRRCVVEGASATELLDAPSTSLRLVPLPRFAVEEHGEFSARSFNDKQA
jgi:hypothetical protein